MPQISVFFGIIIRMYYDEHNPGLSGFAHQFFFVFQEDRKFVAEAVGLWETLFSIIPQLESRWITHQDSLLSRASPT